jgi:hypothetical protein
VFPKDNWKFLSVSSRLCYNFLREGKVLYFSSLVLYFTKVCKVNINVREKMSADIGLIGLAVMGENLVLNMESHVRSCI